ncbi:MAG: PadR family transcriptional regulator [archaeon]
MAKGQLKHVMLRCLGEGPQSGYGLAKRIEEQSGSWKPSFGSIYPHLKTMHNDGLLKTKKSGRKIIYSLTPHGKEELKAQGLTDKDLVEELMGRCKMLFPGLEELTPGTIDLLDKSSRGENPLKDVQEETVAIKKVFMDLYAKGLISKKKKEINAVLNRAVRDLKKLL